MEREGRSRIPVLEKDRTNIEDIFKTYDLIDILFKVGENFLHVSLGVGPGGMRRMLNWHTETRLSIWRTLPRPQDMEALSDTPLLITCHDLSGGLPDVFI